MSDKSNGSGRTAVAAQGRQDVVMVCGVVALAAALLGLFAWLHPTTKHTSSRLSYTQSGRLSYSAKTQPGSVYGKAGVRTGNPVYTDSVRALQVGFSYGFDAPQSASLAGTEQLVATIQNTEGLSRRIPLQKVTAFRGQHFEARGVLDLGALRRAADAFSRAAANQYPGPYTVSITPSVTVHGRVGGAALHTTLNSPTKFTLSTTALSPVSTGGLGTVATPETFRSSGNGSVSVPEARPATFLHLRVSEVRELALVLLAASLLIGALFGRSLMRDANDDDERVRIAMRYGASLVDANGLPDDPRVVVVELASIAALAEVAQRLECPILQHGDVYAVLDNGSLYRYTIPAPASIRVPAGATDLIGSEGGELPRFPRPEPEAATAARWTRRVRIGSER